MFGAMSYKSKLLPPMVSAAIVLVVVTNFCIVQILGRPGQATSDLLWTILPLALPSSVAVILIMSTLYHTLGEVMEELEHRRLEAIKLAQYDALTGLANKRLLDERVEQAIARYRRTGERFSLLMIDLDDFKRVNDLLGHQAGDVLLKEAAGRLESLVRETDTVARFGGDEFLVLQSDINSRGDVRRLCTRIAEEMQRPYLMAERESRLPVSIGAVLATDDLREGSDYIRAADVALYAAKANGRNCFQFFTEELDAELRRRDVLENDLRDALLSGRGLAVHFQPQIDARGNVVGAEALFRWTHGDLGKIAALEAISIAEECGLIEPLGEYVMCEAARFARRWPELSVAVNVSPAQFSKAGNLPENLREIVEREAVQPGQIEVEITEQLFMQEHTRCGEQMERLRKYGFRLALDDFGTGYSSLSYLRRFKVDRLKLDRSFASEAELHESVAVVRAAVNLAHSLGLEVVAEGIETDIQEAVALEAGCDVLQGNRYGSPMLADDFSEYLKGRRLAAA